MKFIVMIFLLVGMIFHWIFEYASTVNKYLNYFDYHENTRLNNNSTPCICKFAKVQIIIFTQL